MHFDRMLLLLFLVPREWEFKQIDYKKKKNRIKI